MATKTKRGGRAKQGPRPAARAGGRTVTAARTPLDLVERIQRVVPLVGASPPGHSGPDALANVLGEVLPPLLGDPAACAGNPDLFAHLALDPSAIEPSDPLLGEHWELRLRVGELLEHVARAGRTQRARDGAAVALAILACLERATTVGDSHAQRVAASLAEKRLTCVALLSGLAAGAGASPLTLAFLREVLRGARSDEALAAEAAEIVRAESAAIYPHDAMELWTYLWARRATGMPTFERTADDMAMGTTTIKKCMDILKAGGHLSPHDDGTWVVAKPPASAPGWEGRKQRTSRE